MGFGPLIPSQVGEVDGSIERGPYRRRGVREAQVKIGQADGHCEISALATATAIEMERKDSVVKR